MDQNNTNTGATQFLTIEQALVRVQEMGIHCSEVRMRRLARDKVLPFFKDGRRLYITRAALDGYYQKQAAKVAA